jgi:hypothetical protein
MTTSDDKEALARRAVQCKGWGWMPGMLTTGGLRIVAVDPVDDGSGVGPAYGYEPSPEHHGARTRCYVDTAFPEVPDLDDPATLGCLLALVRQAWGEPAAHPAAYTTGVAVAEYQGPRPERAVDSEGGGWHVIGWGVNRGRGRVMDVLRGFNHRSETEAIVVALESAP